MCNSSRTKAKFNSAHHNFCGILLVLGVMASVAPALAQSTLVGTEIQSISDRGKETKADSTLLRQGKAYYEAGNYAEATVSWEKAYQQYKAQGHLINQALTLSYLSLGNQKQENWQAAKEYISQSLEILQSQPKLKGKNLSIYAQAINTQGQLELATGKIESAIETWKKAAQVYQKAGDDIGTLGSKINQAQALQNLGLYRRSQKLLIKVASQLQEKPDSRLKISGLRTLGVALQVTGNLNDAQELLQESLTISKRLNLPEETSQTLFSLGDVARAFGERNKRRNSDNTTAYALYEQAAAITSQPLLKVEAQLNQLNTLIAFEQWQLAKNLLPEVQTNVSQLSTRANRRSIYAQINLAKSLIDLADRYSQNQTYFNQSQNLLTKATQQARQIQDLKAESYALGILGHLREQQQEWSLGQKYTEQAINLAQRINEPELIYQWQWQLGRLQVVQKNYSDAIASYSEAVNALESLRSDLVLTNLDVQYSFRDTVEPVYRELVKLLLQPQNNQPTSQANLIKARDTIESLQLAELNDFFREACLDATPTSIENVDPEAAVIYPIILDDRLAIILSLPGQPLNHYSTEISQTELEAAIEELRETVVIRSQRSFRKPAQNLYDWLIRPVLKDLVTSEIKTLVFVPDGSFRNIPMGVLHDKENYLIEQYNIALTPGLQLLAPRPLKESGLKTLAAGLTEERQGFAPLDYVQVELEDIKQQLDSTVLIDQEFTRESLQNTMESAQYPIVHIATHGQFSSILEDTFLLTWDSRIEINQLNSILQNRNPQQQNPIELLVLSACETAVGDDRAALGLAGMAVRAGARSTLATLWSVNDQATALAINNFYQQLNQSEVSISKTQALTEAQLTLLNSTKFNHPYYWSSFVLIGNWL